jgi:large subunit ribosomal protein L1
MKRVSKKRKEILAKYDLSKVFTLSEACDLVKGISTTKFDASIDICVRLGVDPRKANQMVRGTVALPHGTGKDKAGWTSVDVIITMPSVMGKVGALGRILGPRGLMPNPKTGTVTMDIGKAVEEVKAGKIDFKVDKYGIVHAGIGKVSFDGEKIRENAHEIIQTLVKLKPSAAKGTYIKSIYLSSTMSPGIQIDAKSVTA